MDPDPKDELSEMEMEAVTTVFRQYETGLREAAINARVFSLFNDYLVMHQKFFCLHVPAFFSLQDLLAALKSLGMNTMEQEVIDMTNTVARNGLIFFPEFCQIVLKRFREENEEEFAQVMFKVKSADILDKFNDLS